MTHWLQKTIQLKPHRRGAHLVTGEVLRQLDELSEFKIGQLHLFLQHTSASLSINENADPTVRSDLSAYIDRYVPENEPYYQHTLEGADDMPAHIKTAMFGFDLTIPLSDGRLNLGTWQGIYLLEHRNQGGGRRIVATISGEKF
jgi:secondary thiamine-phosphate synthase enzyme